MNLTAHFTGGTVNSSRFATELACGPMDCDTTVKKGVYTRIDKLPRRAMIHVHGDEMTEAKVVSPVRSLDQAKSDPSSKMVPESLSPWYSRHPSQTVWSKQLDSANQNSQLKS